MGCGTSSTAHLSPTHVAPTTNFGPGGFPSSGMDSPRNKKVSLVPAPVKPSPSVSATPIAAPPVQQQTQQQQQPLQNPAVQALNPSTPRRSSSFNRGRSGSFSESMRKGSIRELLPPGGIPVLFGTCTGISERFARQLASKGKSKLGMEFTVYSMAEADIKLLKRFPVVLFITSSTGIGHPPDNARTFASSLMTTTESLGNLKFGLFGLGDSSYSSSYQGFPKQVFNRLVKLGANAIIPAGQGDSLHDQKGAFDKWCEIMFTTLKKHVKAPPAPTAASSAIENNSSNLQFALELLTPSNMESVKRTQSMDSLDSIALSRATVLDNEDICPDGVACRRIVFETSLSYQAGDHLLVFPRNNAHIVKALLNRLQLTGNQSFLLKDKDNKSPFPCPCTFSAAFLQYLDIQNMSQEILEVLAVGCTNAPQQARLKALAQNQSEFEEYIVHGHRTLLDLLEEFKSSNPSIPHLLQVLQRLSPRYFSISSSPHVDKNQVAITARIIDIKVSSSIIFKGVCTNYLAGLPVKADVPITIRRSEFHLPAEHDQKIIMVCAGTGIAPFIGFIEDMQARKYRGATMIFGCRHPDQDFLYHDFLEKAEHDGTLSHLYIAFSRQQSRKVYVQDVVEDHGSEIWDQLQRGAFFYVCGATTMAQGVREALIKTAAEKYNCSEDEAKIKFNNLQSSNHYLEDVWAMH